MMKLTGLYLFQKDSQEQKVLKELLQYVRTTQRSSSHSFSYIEAETSLHPQLSLWENLRLEAGVSSWNEFKSMLRPECLALVNLLTHPEKTAISAEPWEKFIVSLLKGMINSSQNLLIDVNEEVLNPFVIRSIKNALMSFNSQKTIVLATYRSSLWLECTHTLVKKNEYQFETETFDSDLIKKYWAA